MWVPSALSQVLDRELVNAVLDHLSSADSGDVAGEGLAAKLEAVMRDGAEAGADGAVGGAGVVTQPQGSRALEEGNGGGLAKAGAGRAGGGGGRGGAKGQGGPDAGPTPRRASVSGGGTGSRRTGLGRLVARARARFWVEVNALREDHVYADR